MVIGEVEVLKENIWRQKIVEKHDCCAFWHKLIEGESVLCNKISVDLVYILSVLETTMKK